MDGPGRTTGILFVCLGNICRSPLAHGVMEAKVAERGLADRIAVDSCGTGDWHLGQGADPGSVEVARRNGVDLSRHRARRFRRSDPGRFRWIVCMDRSNVWNVRSMVPGLQVDTVLLRDFDPEGRGDVPDPWGRGSGAFEEVYRIVERSCEVLLDRVLEALG